MSDRSDARNILVWHVHGSWLDAFVRGGHRYLVPTLPGRGPWGRGRMGRDWPPNAEEIVRHVTSRTRTWTSWWRRSGRDTAGRPVAERLPGRDVPLVYVEHNTPGGPTPPPPAPDGRS
ncbi:hypothetical protein GS489_33800 [Rhodococcus hoagii]|nr:hypothetical protein [Prescottella equi]